MPGESLIPHGKETEQVSDNSSYTAGAVAVKRRDVADDLEMQQLAGEVLELREHIASLETDIAIYSDLAREAIEALHALTTRNVALRKERNDFEAQVRQLMSVEP